ncbi:hypothetical protein ALC62_08258 [Cyphomyrmex costatus]|uniref:Uncharacterized protein n=1 Tax=Cyphomyrmex costatus TaxID=456900 RepID=A0A195CKQ1_9HYME|nr:hypothetical protein ALC62_08258 [Cyphomyrmex costatus]
MSFITMLFRYFNPNSFSGSIRKTFLFSSVYPINICRFPPPSEIATILFESTFSTESNPLSSSIKSDGSCSTWNIIGAAHKFCKIPLSLLIHKPKSKEAYTLPAKLKLSVCQIRNPSLLFLCCDQLFLKYFDNFFRAKIQHHKYSKVSIPLMRNPCDPQVVLPVWENFDCLCGLQTLLDINLLLQLILITKAEKYFFIK